MKTRNCSRTTFRYLIFVIRCSVFSIFPFALNAQSDVPPNPFITNIFTADPSAHVWQDGRLYLYPSHDIAPPRGCDLMDQYHVFSTDDMIHWTDHGEILRATDVPWGRPEGGFMWAPDCAYKDGTYYFYFPHPSESAWNTTWKIGVATSSSPTSGFTVQGYIPNLDSHIDPTVFIDDDGQAYFYYGGGGVCKGGKLKANMMEIDGEMQTMQGLEDFHEATWVHKRNGVYYLSHSDNYDGNRMRYATSSSPLGPWTAKGIYMDPTDSYTNHGSIVEFKGQWYAFYHNSALSGNDWLRSVCVDKLFYNEDGTIQKVIPTKGHGTPHGNNAWTIPGKIEAEDFDEGGQIIAYSDSDSSNNGGQYRPTEFVDIENCGEGGFNVGWVSGGEWLEYTVNVAQAGTYVLEIRVASANASGSSVRVEFGTDDKTGKITVPNTGGWQSYQTVSKEISLDAGQHIMRLVMGDGAFNINYVDIKEKEIVLAAVEEGAQIFKVFPNPVAGKLVIAFDQDVKKSTSMKMYDSSGVVVKKQKLVAKETEIPTDGLAPGLYLLQVRVKDETITRKIMIK